jgi:3-hydroxybutyryl-CoA dehydratase
MVIARVVLGERMQRRLCVDAAAISRFARLCGDQNPIHHDAAHAGRTRFGKVVMSGPQLAGLLMGLSATHFSQPGPNGPRAMLGLDFRFRFQRAVLADECIDLRWDVVAIRRKESLGGEVAFLAGNVCNAAGEHAVKAVGKVLVRDTL